LDIEISGLDGLNHCVKPFFGHITLDVGVLDIHGDVNSSVKLGISGIFLKDKVVFGVIEEIDEIDGGIEVVIVSGGGRAVTEDSETANLKGHFSWQNGKIFTRLLWSSVSHLLSPDFQVE